MQITQITVSAGRTFNDPYEQYANYKPYLTLTATIDPDTEDPTACVQGLQHQAETLMDAHKRKMLSDMCALHETNRMLEQAEELEALIKRSTERLAQLRKAKILSPIKTQIEDEAPDEWCHVEEDDDA